MKKKVALHIVFILLLAIPLYFVFNAWITLNDSTSPSYTYETVTATEPRVYVTNTGYHYHSSSCQYLYNSKIAMGKNEAISKGYSACSKCGGKASGTIQTTYKKRVEKDNSSRNIWGSILLSIFISPVLYGIGAFAVHEYKERQSWKNATSTATKSSDNASAPLVLDAPQKPQVLVREGSIVKHKSFGQGTVIEFDGHYLTIEFPIGEKKFVYPDSFDTYLDLLKY